LSSRCETCFESAFSLLSFASSPDNCWRLDLWIVGGVDTQDSFGNGKQQEKSAEINEKTRKIIESSKVERKINRENVTRAESNQILHLWRLWRCLHGGRGSKLVKFLTFLGDSTNYITFSTRSTPSKFACRPMTSTLEWWTASRRPSPRKACEASTKECQLPSPVLLRFSRFLSSGSVRSGSKLSIYKSLILPNLRCRQEVAPRRREAADKRSAVCRWSLLGNLHDIGDGSW
jgi:hypothetical protein